MINETSETTRRNIAIQLIADAELRVAAARVLATSPTTTPDLFGKRAMRVFQEVIDETLNLTTKPAKRKRGNDE